MGNLYFKVLICCKIIRKNTIFIDILLYLKIFLKGKFEIQFIKKGNFIPKFLKKHWSLCLNVSVKNIFWWKIILHIVNRYVQKILIIYQTICIINNAFWHIYMLFYQFFFCSKKWFQQIHPKKRTPIVFVTQLLKECHATYRYSWLTCPLSFNWSLRSTINSWKTTK